MPGGPAAGFTAARQLLVVSGLLFAVSAGLAAFGSMWTVYPALAGTVTIIASGQREGARRRPGTSTASRITA
ncbi:hypothetical protein [Phytohabitans suffuscus]|uniref:Uncharacterized protein n=1 Tax=Phytohabitans suffuscus TaxID=624315 RepID=A0A6F8YY69_9ACTN|nr:hypothetical protein [Phytohabitans suffuscus]BCB90888.1 hypothetical protein Psuf_082010 [Phytohabitans suffuscus]